MNPNLERALVLYAQNRPDLTERELRRVLAAEPDDPQAHAWLSLCLARLNRLEAATAEAEEAVRLAPDEALAHYARASVLHDRDRLDEAAAAVEEAIRLDPLDPDHFALLANIRLDQRRWPAALAAAEQGLALDAEHVPSANLRSVALVKLGRGEEAGLTIDAALARDPENAFTHASQGWALLHRGDHTRAQEHFREALRLDPTMEWAREGIVESLKARNPVYALLLRYFLWMSRLGQRAQWAVMIGGYLGYQVLRGVARSNPALAPVITPLLVAYGVFAISTWLADPFFNLILRLDRFGRHALSREQLVASNWIGGFLLAAMLSGLAWLVLRQPALLGLALLAGALLLPLAGAFQVRAGGPRRKMAIYTAIVAGVGVVGLLASLEPPRPAARDSLLGNGSGLLSLAVLGAMLSGWVANALAMVRPKR